MSFSIVPGAVLTDVSDSPANCGERVAQHRRMALPATGGVGHLPLPVVHQGKLPICTGVAAANARMILHYQETGQVVPFSGLFIYKMNRLFDGLPREMKGSTLEASMQTLTHKGVCPERYYPSTGRNCSREFPADGRALLEKAMPYRMAQYQRCTTLEEILQALAEGHPVAFSMVISTDFYEARRGVVPIERKGSRIGGHSMVAVNYDLERGLLQVLQSWGTAPGGPTDRGYMYIPFVWFDRMDELTEHSVLIEAFAFLEASAPAALQQV